MLKYWNNSQMFWKPILRTFLVLASCAAPFVQLSARARIDTYVAVAKTCHTREPFIIWLYIWPDFIICIGILPSSALHTNSIVSRTTHFAVKNMDLEGGNKSITTDDRGGRCWGVDLVHNGWFLPLFCMCAHKWSCRKTRSLLFRNIGCAISSEFYTTLDSA